MDFIDLHSHLLWNVDDGAEDFSVTEKILASAVKNNILFICATPHINRDQNMDIPATIEKVNRRFAELNQYIKEKKVPVSMVLGFETYFSFDILKLKDSDLKKICLGDTSYILIELPFEKFSPGIINGIYELRKRGYDPIVVHPERSRQFMENPGLLLEMNARDIVFQVNTGSVLGKNGREIQKLVKKLIKAGLVHLVASDIHNVKISQDPYGDLQLCYAQLADFTSPGFADLMMKLNPERVLSNRIITEPDQTYPQYLAENKLSTQRLLSPFEKLMKKFTGPR